MHVASLQVIDQCTIPDRAEIGDITGGYSAIYSLVRTEINHQFEHAHPNKGITDLQHLLMEK
jgi:hypothetical protein